MADFGAARHTLSEALVAKAWKMHPGGLEAGALDPKTSSGMEPLLREALKYNGQNETALFGMARVDLAKFMTKADKQVLSEGEDFLDRYLKLKPNADEKSLITLYETVGKGSLAREPASATSNSR